MPPFTHLDANGRPQMVDVTNKRPTRREATAQASIRMLATTRQAIEEETIRKGNVLSIAELAGIMGAKRTSDLIPLCHPLPIQSVQMALDWQLSDNPEAAVLLIRATVVTTYQTGVEMEALTACTCAALTIYDMCKAVDRAMSILHIHLLTKSGGQSGTFTRATDASLD